MTVLAGAAWNGGPVVEVVDRVVGARLTGGASLRPGAMFACPSSSAMLGVGRVGIGGTVVPVWAVW